ncbi:FAD-dependent oxidoreductase [Herbiconiux sp. CPCC 203407]|uniref:FAD-dependent oxidoreductase n=1 Tax=Herbiconiux oxytropis TaxID=2970915 RepID=A0AA42BTY5_9MICO|nr:FAD-dependent oxidoreductase [Herbiconiux oxytropis]MCS5726950.1 FAD-dependent oxidoreductase [Herbiconiux oxytropis]
MTERVEVVVVGGGAMGSAAAWHLARRGHDVVLLERFEPGHRNGASHGATRNFNLGYAQPEYLGMLQEALPLWRALETETGTALLDQVGIVNHGGPLEGYRTVARALAEHGFDAEFVPPREAGERWPGLRFEGEVLFTPQAGQVNADASVRALQAAAAARGARVRHGRRVTGIRVQGDDRVSVSAAVLDPVSGEPTGEEEHIEARRAVVALGAWTSALLGDLVPLPRLVVTQEQPAHFAVRPGEGRGPWPGFNHQPVADDPRYDYWPSPIYGMLTPGEGVKAGWHGVGPVIDPDARSFRSEPGQLAALQRYVREWVPGADPDAFTEISCTYTTTPTSDFVVDRHGPLVVAAGFSGHGFKFTPVIGRLLADLVDAPPTGPSPSPALFALSR